MHVYRVWRLLDLRGRGPLLHGARHLVAQVLLLTSPEEQALSDELTVDVPSLDLASSEAKLTLAGQDKQIDALDTI